MILLVLLQMVGQMIDSLGQEGNLYIGGPGVSLVQLEIIDRLRFRLHVVN